MPERRIARLLAGWIACGLFFLVLPGTLMGVLQLIRSSADRQPPISSAFLQAHGHAQLFGWVGTFIIGISLYTLPKFRGSFVRSIPLGWAMLALWVGGVAARWVGEPRIAALAEPLCVLLLVWQCSGKGKGRTGAGLWEYPIYSGFTGLLAALLWQAWMVFGQGARNLFPEEGNRLLLWLAVWWFCFPVVWGYSLRFLPSLAGTGEPRRRWVMAGLVLLLLAGVTRNPSVLLGAVGCAVGSLNLLNPGRTAAKTKGVDPWYPGFIYLSFSWLLVAATMNLWSAAPGMLGASRHAFTVGFLATLILSLGPRILPSFLNSRELWSIRLMRVSMVLLACGCALRVVSEPLAYGRIVVAAWQALPVSAVLELTAVCAFAVNIAMTMALPAPVWVLPRHLHGGMTLYWCVVAYPETRSLLVRAGLRTLETAAEIPPALTLAEAAQADGVELETVLEALRGFVGARQARALHRRDAGTPRKQTQ